ncbi:MAG: ATP-binding protein [Alphaproteobacteria bacterium]|nr:MAG: ATP-binding protein [Alphaproteobacteria bacterium]
MSNSEKHPLLGVLGQISEALSRLSPNPALKADLNSAEAFSWQPHENRLEPVPEVNRVPLEILLGLPRQRDTLLANTRQFATGLPANNALLWGARGMGKSSLVKAVHHEIAKESPLKLIEIHREDIETLPRLMKYLRDHPFPCLIFCDDLSFDGDDTSYKSLKAVLEGGIEGRPSNVLFYATSNRRHLMPRDMMENERSTAINPSESVEEKVSLSDRFGLWLGFHKCTQSEYLDMIRGYVAHYQLAPQIIDVEKEALEWATTRGARSGRVAWQYIQDLAGRLGQPL